MSKNRRGDESLVLDVKSLGALQNDRDRGR